MTHQNLHYLNNNINDFCGKNVHFIGVLGASMRGLARLVLDIGANVSGSDSTYSETLDILVGMGVRAYVGHDVSVVANADIVVYSGAIAENDTELAFARMHNICCIDRAVLLAIIMNSSDTGVAIAGSHGKSTTTAVIDNILKTCGKSATVHVGAELSVGETMANGLDIFVTEACEYKRSFLKLHPTIGVVLGIDYDHPDEYSNIDDMKSAFDEYMDNSDIVVAHESVDRENAITYGTRDSADYVITDIRKSNDKYVFTLVHADESVDITCPLHGVHNVLNVTAAYIVASILGVERGDIIEGIATFSGLKRRFEDKGYMSNGARVIHDYAHHPEEIERTIATATTMTKGKLIVVFEPHTYSRTRSLIDRFCGAFYWADSLILLPTYSAREVESDGYNTLELIRHLREVGEYPLYFESYKRAVRYLQNNSTSGDTVLVLGAGSIYHLADMLVE